MTHTAHEHDDLFELGGLSPDELDQLAIDLRQEQDLAQERKHVTDGTPCWCEPTTIDPEIELGLEPDGGIDGTTGLPLGVGAPIVNAGGGGLDPWLPGLLQPLNDQVFLVRVQPPDRTASGLAIPESAQSKGCECRVLAAGPGAKNARTGKRIPMSVAAEDRVVIGKWQGNEVTVPDYVRAAWGIDDREPVIVVRETDILAVLAPASEVCAWQWQWTRA